MPIVKVETAVSIISVLVASGFICSLIYDYAFFSHLGLSFRQWPTTLSDHLRSGILWTPYIAIYTAPVLIAIFLSKINTSKRLNNNLEYNEYYSNKKMDEIDNHKKRLRKITKFYYIFHLSIILVFSLILLISFYYFSIYGEKYWFSVVISFVLFCFVAFTYFLRRKILRALKKRSNVTLIIALFGMVPFLAYAWGTATASFVIFSLAPEMELNLIHNVNAINIRVLRNLESGLLYMDNEGYVGFRPWHQIEGMKLIKKYEPDRFLYCERFNWCAAQPLQKVE